MIKYLFLPLDFLYLTLDAFRISLDMFVYFPIRSDRDQPCIHCKNADCGYQPRPLPPGLTKYHNRWLGCWLQPCTRKEVVRERGSRYVCIQDGGFVKYNRRIRLLTLTLTAFWVWVLYKGYGLIF